MREYVAIFEKYFDGQDFSFVAYIVPKENSADDPLERKKSAVSLIFHGSDKNILRVEVIKYFLETQYLFKVGDNPGSFGADDTLFEYTSKDQSVEIARRND